MQILQLLLSPHPTFNTNASLAGLLSLPLTLGRDGWSGTSKVKGTGFNWWGLLCACRGSFPSWFSCNSPMSWRICGFKDMFLLCGPDVKIISYSSAFIHTHLHLHSQSQTCIYIPTQNAYPEIGFLATWCGSKAAEKASWPYQLVTCLSKIPPLNIYPFGSPQSRIKYLWSRQHTIKLSSNILAGTPFAQGTSPCMAGWLLLILQVWSGLSCLLPLPLD